MQLSNGSATGTKRQEPKFGFSHSPSANPIIPLEVNGTQIEISDIAWF